MALIISVHSFHRGVGKTFAAANLGTALAVKGKRIGLVDANLQSPGLHYLFGIAETALEYSLNDYLHGRTGIQQATYNITPQLKTELEGEIYLTPASIEAEDIMYAVREGYNLESLAQGLHDLSDKLDLDVLIIDAQAGLDEHTLKIMALSQSLVMVMRLEQNEYQGTGVMIDVARKLDIGRVQILANQVPHIYFPPQIEEQIKTAYHCPLLMSIPYSEEVIEMAGKDVFVLRHPQSAISLRFGQVVSQFTS